MYPLCHSLFIKGELLVIQRRGRRLGSAWNTATCGIIKPVRQTILSRYRHPTRQPWCECRICFEIDQLDQHITPLGKKIDYYLWQSNFIPAGIFRLVPHPLGYEQYPWCTSSLSAWDCLPNTRVFGNSDRCGICQMIIHNEDFCLHIFDENPRPRHIIFNSLQRDQNKVDPVPSGLNHVGPLVQGER